MGLALVEQSHHLDRSDANTTKFHARGNLEYISWLRLLVELTGTIYCECPRVATLIKVQLLHVGRSLRPVRDSHNFSHT